ncbi:MAG: SMI1/KNR4 family protein, partial [Saccharofermentans sp.]|nr:SMI1/KNR4 family protein [Saccharofermentans sp.]
MDIESIISQINAGYEVTETDLNSIENSLGIKISPLMRDYYLRYNGAWVKTIYAKGIDGDIYGLHGISPIKYKNKPAGNN